GRAIAPDGSSPTYAPLMVLLLAGADVVPSRMPTMVLPEKIVGPPSDPMVLLSPNTRRPVAFPAAAPSGASPSHTYFRPLLSEDSWMPAPPNPVIDSDTNAVLFAVVRRPFALTPAFAP